MSDYIKTNLDHPPPRPVQPRRRADWFLIITGLVSLTGYLVWFLTH